MQARFVVQQVVERVEGCARENLGVCVCVCVCARVQRKSGHCEATGRSVEQKGDRRLAMGLGGEAEASVGGVAEDGCQKERGAALNAPATSACCVNTDCEGNGGESWEGRASVVEGGRAGVRERGREGKGGGKRKRERERMRKRW